MDLGSQSKVDAFLKHLDNHLISSRRQLAEVFAEHDRDGSGAIERAELEALIRRLMPGAAATDVQQARAICRPGNYWRLRDTDLACECARTASGQSDMVH